jgi:hypothetical protein
MEPTGRSRWLLATSLARACTRGAILAVFREPGLYLCNRSWLVLGAHTDEIRVGDRELYVEPLVRTQDGTSPASACRCR